MTCAYIVIEMDQESMPTTVVKVDGGSVKIGYFALDALQVSLNNAQLEYCLPD